MNTETFTVEVTYFKKSGKFYTRSSFDREFSSGVGYMNDMVEYIEGILKGNGDVKLPGLQSHTWDGYIVVDCEKGFPTLIKPERYVITGEIR